MFDPIYPPATTAKAVGKRHLQERARAYRKAVANLRRRMGRDPKADRRAARQIAAMSRWLADHSV